LDIKISIQAPELVSAIHALAQALGATRVNQDNAQAAATVETYQTQPVPVSQPSVQQEQSQTVPTSSPTYTMDQLAVAATQLMDAGKREELINLLNSFGVQALTALPQEQYGAFATKLRELGANV
jgi:hypothetical protein